MDMTSNTILITGGGSGIGRGLAEAFHRLGNQVVIAGRRESTLDRVTAANPGMRAVRLDIESHDFIRSVGQQMAAEFPNLNVLINNAGIQRPENLKAPSDDLADVDAMVTTNLSGPIRLTAALLPLLRRQPRSTIMNVTSGLAFVPGAGVPTYSATKAAMHSYTQSLRHQLRNTMTEVIEVIPPYVQTDLGSGHGTDPRAMPLAEFITEVMTILKDVGNDKEVVVDRCKPLRFAVERGTFNTTFSALNGIAMPAPVSAC
jgi:uncharacterized oxidoreductase